MIDLRYDVNINDLVLTNGDFEELERVSEQNGSVIFLKSCTSLLRPQFGFGFEDWSWNVGDIEFGAIEGNAETMMRRDGAIYASVRIVRELETNRPRHRVVYPEVGVEIRSRYRE